MSASWPQDVNLVTVIEDWVYAQRWFPGSPTSLLKLVDNVDLSALSAPLDWDQETPLDPVWISLIRVSPDSGAGEDGAVIQVPLVFTDRIPNEGAGVIARVGDAWLVDGPQHPAFWRAWIRLSAQQGHLGEFPTGEDAQVESLKRELLTHVNTAHVLTGEQSNTSVKFDSDPSLVVKVFRLVTPGEHPDLEIPLALSRSGWTHVAAPRAHVAVTLDGREAVSGIAADFKADAHDGFEFFVDLAARGVDPSPEARTLGQITAQMHQHLADAFGVSEANSPQALAERIRVGVQASSAEVLQLDDELVDGLLTQVNHLGDLDHLPDAIRIHGDYHLGQTLLTPDGWVVLDFEGEPLRSLEERRRPDLTMRDVAGMLCSFNYASAQAAQEQARSHLHNHSTAEIPVITSGDSAGQPHIDQDWLNAAREAFIAGYTDGHGFTHDQQVIVRALEIEKAAYEVVYEHRLRPSWLPIPLQALKDLA